MLTRSIWKMLGPQRAASRQFTRCRHRTVARRLHIDVHNDNDNAWQRGLLWPHGMGPISRCVSSMGFISQRRGMAYRDGILLAALCKEDTVTISHVGARCQSVALTIQCACYPCDVSRQNEFLQLKQASWLVHDLTQDWDL